MAVHWSRAALLCLLAAVINTSEGFGFRPGMLGGETPSPADLLERLPSDCLPDDFALPDSVTAAAEECKSSSAAEEQEFRPPRFPSGRFPFGGRGRRSPRRFGRGRGRHHGPKGTELLTCIAQQLNLTTDSGVDSAAVDSFIDSLSSNTTWTDQQKANAAECLADMSADLTADQQGAYILTCLKMRFKLDCAQLTNDTTGKLPCVQAMALKMCPLSLAKLAPLRVMFQCYKRQAIAEHIGDGLQAIAGKLGDLLGGGDLSGNLSEICATKYDAVRTLTNCTLQASGLADGDTVNVTALRTALEGTSTANESLALLDECVANGAADTVDALIDCWAELAPDACVSVLANAIAQKPIRSAGRPGRGGRGRQRGRGRGRPSGFPSGFRRVRGNRGPRG